MSSTWTMLPVLTAVISSVLHQDCLRRGRVPAPRASQNHTVDFSSGSHTEAQHGWDLKGFKGLGFDKFFQRISVLGYWKCMKETSCRLFVFFIQCYLQWALETLTYTYCRISSKKEHSLNVNKKKIFYVMFLSDNLKLKQKKLKKVNKLSRKKSVYI